MANSKISALTSATTVAGTEVLPIVQSSATVKVSIANLTPGLDTITAAKGGTGQTSYAVGDLLYANTTTTLAKLADVATGNAVISGGVGVAPSYGKIGLTTHVSGVLPVANGGTNASSASITAFNNITGYSASGATGTTSTNLVFSTSPTLTTPIVATTIGVGGATASASGSGVTFPATQSASSNANTLDDYEEGTFDVAITPASGSVVMSNVRLQYTKVGRQVTITGECNITSVSTPSGAVTIGNLPFVNSGNSQRSSRTGFFIRAGSFTGVPLGVCVGFINVNVSVIDVSAVNNFVFADIGANLQAGTSFMFSFSYMTTT